MLFRSNTKARSQGANAPFTEAQIEEAGRKQYFSITGKDWQGGASATTNNMNIITGLLDNKPTAANHQTTPYNNFTAYYGGHSNDLGS